MKLPRWWPVVALVVGVALWQGYGCARAWDGAHREQLKQDARTIAAYRKAIVALGSRIPQVDTVAGKAATVYRTAKVDYQHIADSIAAAMKAQGQPTPPVVLACNAALAAADTALSACARQVAIRDNALAKRDTLEWAQDSLIAHLKKRKPFLLRIGKPLVPFLGGVIAGAVLTK